MRQIADDHLRRVDQLGGELSVRHDDDAKRASRLLLIRDIPVPDPDPDALQARQALLQRLGDRHRAVASAGAADPDRQVRSSLPARTAGSGTSAGSACASGTRASPSTCRGTCTTSSSRPVCGRSFGTKCGFGRKRTSNSRSESTGMPCLKPKLRIVTTSCVPGARPARDAGERVPQLVDRHLRRVDDVVRHPADRLHRLRLLADALERRAIRRERVRPARLAEAPDERPLRRFEEDQHRVQLPHLLQPLDRPSGTPRASCPSRMSTTTAAREISLPARSVSSASIGSSAIGRLSTQK